MVKVSPTDFKFLWRLSSLYEALTISAVDPVVLLKGIGNEPGGMFYDCYEDTCEDTKKAIAVMEQRVARASDDIRQHYQAHQLFLRCFYDIDELMNTQNRKRVGEVTNDLCAHVSDYLSLVEQHELRLEEDSFLYPPTCFPGHYFQIPNSGIRIIPQLKFNPARTGFQGEIYLGKIKNLVPDFSKGKGRLPPIKVATQEDSGEGILDTSLRGRIELNKELLIRIGSQL